MTRPDADGLTARQRAVLECISDAVTTRGYPPSMREIGDTVGLTSPSSVAYQLNALEAKGRLRRDPRLPRAMELVGQSGPATAAPRPRSSRNRSGGLAVGAPEDSDASLVRVDVSRGGPRAGRGRPTRGHRSDALLQTAQVPVVGRIAAGRPILAEQQVEDVFSLPRQLVGEGELFTLRVVGDSMVDAAICDGDYVVVRSQPVAETGEIVAAMLDGEATVKTYRHTGDQVWLMPANSAYDPIDGRSCEVLGRVVAVLRSV